MSKLIGIYKITSPTDKVYIGQSKDLNRRVLNYEKLNCKKQTRLYHSLKKHGWEAHTFEIVEECEFEQLNIRERYWQDFYDVLGENGLNCVLVQTSTLPSKVSEGTLKKMSDSKKGELNYYYGKPLHENTKKASIKSNIGRVRSEEEIQFRRDRMIGELNPNYKKDFSKETRKKMSESRKGKYAGGEHLKAKRVVQKSTGRVFETIKEACEELNISRTAISLQLNGKSFNKHGLYFEDSDLKGNIYQTISKRITKIILDDSTGVFYYSSREASETFNIYYTTLSRYLSGAKSNTTNLKYV